MALDTTEQTENEISKRGKMSENQGFSTGTQRMLSTPISLELADPKSTLQDLLVGKAKLSPSYTCAEEIQRALSPSKKRKSEPSKRKGSSQREPRKQHQKLSDGLEIP